MSTLLLAVIVYIVGIAISQVNMWKRIMRQRSISLFLCECGHEKTNHNGSSGPNSNGRYHSGECVVDSSSFPPYRVGGCRCYTFKRDIWLTIKKQIPTLNLKR